MSLITGMRWSAQLLATAGAVLVGCLAAAQTNTANDCKQVPQGLASISAALNICSQVSSLSRKQPLTTEQLRIDESVRENLDAVQQAAANGLRDLQQARLVQEELAAQKKKSEVDWLKVSAYLIGGVGAGAGGALRLVNDKTVMHDGTVVGMAGGLVGAGVNLFGVFCKPCSKNPDMLLSQPVKTYITSAHPKIKIGSFRRHPSRLSPYLTEMNAQITALQENLKVE